MQIEIEASCIFYSYYHVVELVNTRDAGPQFFHSCIQQNTVVAGHISQTPAVMSTESNHHSH